jgi:hypothetical protein
MRPRPRQNLRGGGTLFRAAGKKGTVNPCPEGGSFAEQVRDVADAEARQGTITALCTPRFLAM